MIINKMMNSTRLGKEPIGAVVKQADDVFNRIVRRTSQGDLSRIEWQLLSFLHGENPSERKKIFDHLSFFDAHHNTERILRWFKNKGLVNITSEKVAITDKGEALFREALEVQKKIMERSIQGINESDYSITIATIKTIVNNLREFLPENTAPPANTL